MKCDCDVGGRHLDYKRCGVLRLRCTPFQIKVRVESRMIIYITGTSGSGKTTLLQKLSIKGYDLDDIYESNWKKHKTITTVQVGVKKDIEALVAKHKDIVFVGLQEKKHLTFNPDVVYILVRNDYEQYYRQKLVRDLNLLCKYKKDYEAVLMKKPFDEFRNYFWSNDMVNMKPFKEFKLYVNRQNKGIQADFPTSKLLTADKIVKKIKEISRDVKKRETRKAPRRQTPRPHSRFTRKNLTH